MHLRRIALTVALGLPLALAGAAVHAGEKHDHDHDHDHKHAHDDEHRQHGAHVHGIAALNLALEGSEVHVELDSPAANIVGFEHAPSSEADHAALAKAVALLSDGDELFRFNSEAGCRMKEADITSALLNDDDAHEHGHADEHAHDKHDDHKHDHDHKHDDKHGDHGHDDHAHDKHAGETHSDIDVAYHFECDKPSSLTQLTVELFEAFPGMEEINVQYVIESRQGGAELTPNNHTIRF